jgi:hypothetical protein
MPELFLIPPDLAQFYSEKPLYLSELMSDNFADYEALAVTS